MYYAEASIQIQKPIGEVFDAIVLPSQMSNYFIEASSGKLESGVEVTWCFPEFPDTFPVMGKDIHFPDLISFDWSGGEPDQLVTIILTAINNESTVVRVTEGEMPETREGVLTMARQTGGWANFLACLKAWLEYGVNLRVGAFDYMKTK